jgi:hypothetical protein
MDVRVEAEWVSYPSAEKFSGLSHTTLWRLVGSGKSRRRALAGLCGSICPA